MNIKNAPRNSDRRAFLRGSVKAGALTLGTAVLTEPRLFAENESRTLTKGDVAILRFVAAAELIEADLWQQYAELGGVTTEPTNAYQLAFQNLDSDGNQYISSNTLDELSHAEFLNAYLISKNREPVDFDAFRTLPSSQADGAQNLGRLTNLTELKIDTSWYTRYRSKTNPDFGATFPQALPALFAKKVTAIPRTNADFDPADHIQVIANSAAFHFAMIEQGGSSLYSTLAQRVTNLEVLKIMLSIGGDEVCHFLEWVDFAGNAVQPPVAPVTDPVTKLTFPNFDATPNPLLQTNLIFPIPCEFISPDLPLCAVIRPTAFGQIDAHGAAQSFISSGLLTGQPSQFTELLMDMATEADSARRNSN